MIRIVLFLIFFLASFVSLASQDGVEFTVKTGVARAQVWKLKELKKKLSIEEITVFNPEFQGTFTYKTFRLKDLLLLSGVDAKSKVDELAFTCADGFSPTISYDKARELDLRVAFEEKKGGWTKVSHGKEKITPGPFYVIGKQRESYDVFQWPFQVVSLETIEFRERYGAIFPEGVSQESEEWKGFQFFRSQCLSCHSVNLQGGVVGPELNVPQNITEYHDENYLIRFIKNPSAFQARNKMPAFERFPEADIRAVLSYLKLMKSQKREVKP